jgi:hypothetical protein
VPLEFRSYIENNLMLLEIFEDEYSVKIIGSTLRIMNNSYINEQSDLLHSINSEISIHSSYISNIELKNKSNIYIQYNSRLDLIDTHISRVLQDTDQSYFFATVIME